MAGNSQVATRNRRLHNNLDVIWEGSWEERGLLEGGIVPAEPDMVAGIEAETRDVLLEVAQLYSWFAELVESLKVCVVSF